MKQSLRIVFAGTPDFAKVHLQAIINSHHKIVGVYTQPDRPAGRGRQLQCSPVKELAIKHEIHVFQPESLKHATSQQELALLNPDIIVVVAYGLILPEKVLRIPQYGCINVHASLLPAWRGAAPVQRAIMAGDSESGITIMQMDKGLDTGDMLHKAKVSVSQDDTTATLAEKLSVAGGPALLTVLDEIVAGTTHPESQDAKQATYAHKITKEEGRINWSFSAEQISCHVRGLNPWPVAWSTLQGEVIRCWEVSLQKQNSIQHPPGTIIQADKSGLVVACKDGVVILDTVQLPGKRKIKAVDLLNSHHKLFIPGAVFE
ncbi:MAG: methionyl-tRNA formyltransferase [Endozoicomonadaceae bacterium]|nr:methionyl-tRNA formyltransferase [Endozoicomonadaceae bacterium]MCY4329249.1 methionyl-tRNA formyltransferase [Endozoicomonadaceae bacterium]